METSGPTVCDIMSGIQTPQYKRVRENYDGIISALEDAGSVDAFKRKLVTEGWIGGGNLSADKLIDAVLGRIRQEAKEFDVFYNILRQTRGMETSPILKKLNPPGGMTMLSL